MRLTAFSATVIGMRATDNEALRWEGDGAQLQIQEGKCKLPAKEQVGASGWTVTKRKRQG